MTKQDFILMHVSNYVTKDHNRDVEDYYDPKKLINDALKDAASLWELLPQYLRVDRENTILSYHQALNAIAQAKSLKVIRAIVKETLEINK